MSMTRRAALDQRESVEATQWRAIADMLAYVLVDQVGPLHEGCDPESCSVAYVLARHADNGGSR